MVGLGTVLARPWGRIVSSLSRLEVQRKPAGPMGLGHLDDVGDQNLNSQVGLIGRQGSQKEQRARQGPPGTPGQQKHLLVVCPLVAGRPVGLQSLMGWIV
eukprot:scaffold104965_cov37-Prasinocladus_malaysianus.AAC.1